jgi:hypothetical protein
MVDFLQKAGMGVSIIESGPKSEENTLSQVVKVKCSIVKAEEISDISNATIVNHETAEFLENKPKKTLEEMQSLDRHHIVECYEISPELLTEDFISKYGDLNHMRWFRAYRQLRDAGTDNETAVEASVVTGQGRDRDMGRDNIVQDMFPIFYVRDIFGTIFIYKSRDFFFINIK